MFVIGKDCSYYNSPLWHSGISVYKEDLADSTNQSSN